MYGFKDKKKGRNKEQIRLKDFDKVEINKGRSSK